MTGGEVLRGNASNQYELLARLAQGGMAEIFLARANGLAGFERYVVLKRIRPERDDDPRWVTMFLDEARLAAQLQHPNIAQVFDLGQIGDSFFYTMEFVHGEDVLDVLSRTSALGQRMPLHISLAIAAGACTGLSYAHERLGLDGQPLKIVHRDISPANLMLSFDGVVKVLDFGVAKARNRDTKTEAGTIMGKVAYLSPEQCQTNKLDHRSDLFSLGIVLYEMITHVRPFKRGTDYETLAAIVRFDPPPPSSINHGLPKGVDDLVMKALAKDPNKRFASAAEMLDAIETVADAAQASLAPRDIKRYMRDLYGTRPEPWRTIGGEEQVMGTFSGEVVGPLPTETRIKAFPADAMADEVPLLPLARGAQVLGTPGARSQTTMLTDDDLDDAAFTPHATFEPGLSADDLEEVALTPIEMQPIKVPAIAPQRTTPPPMQVPRGSGPLAAQRTSQPLPTTYPVQVTEHTAPPGTIELVAPPSPFRAIETAPIRVVRPEDQRDGRSNRSWMIIVVTVLAVVGIGIGAMAAMSGGSEAPPRAPATATPTPVAPPPTPTPTPSVTPIEEPPPPPKNNGAENSGSSASTPAVTPPTKVTPPVKVTTPPKTTPSVTPPPKTSPTVTTPPKTTAPKTGPKDKTKKPPPDKGCTDPLECMN